MKALLTSALALATGSKTKQARAAGVRHAGQVGGHQGRRRASGRLGRSTEGILASGNSAAGQHEADELTTEEEQQ